MKASQYTPQSPEERIEGASVLLPLQSRNGFVFLLAKIRKQSVDAEDLNQLLSDQIHRLAESFGSEANAQQRFEQFLGALNETLAQHVREGRWKIPIHQFDAVVGIACEDQMFISGTGDLCALFLHRKQQRYQIFNLFRSIQTEQSLPTWEKAFAVVLDGDLHEGDVFVISNQDLQQTIPPDDLNSILTTLPPKGATEKIRQYFSERDPLLLIILKLSDVRESAHLAESRATLKTDVSVNQFKEREDLTERLLADQIPKISTLIQGMKKYVQRVKEQKIWPFLWGWARRILWNFLKMIGHLKTKEGRVETKNHVLGGARMIQKRALRFVYALTHLPRSTKYLALGIVTVVLLLTLSVSVLSSARARSEEQKTYQEAVAQIEELMERAAGAVIYKDENQARGLYLSASALIAQLPSDTPERAEKIETLNEAIQKATDEIRHLISVPNPALLGDLATLTDGVFGQAFIKIESELYVFASDGRVYQLDRTQKVFKPAGTQIDGTRVATSASAEDQRVFALMTDQSLVQFVRDESAQKTVALTKPEGTIMDLMAYANRLYLLTVTESDGNIFRFGKTGETFGEGSRWINSKTTSLSQARSLTIDGDVFVLQKNGSIERFASGSEVGFETGVVDPPMTNATHIWTDSESAYLYVLEPDTKRVVVFHKETGAFVVQYRSEAFQNLTDIIVDESSYSIYLLAGSKIYSIAPSHITR